MKNYLPFAVREIRTAAAVNFPGGIPPTTSSVQIASLDVGFGERAILQDLSVYAYQATGAPSTQFLMRIGWLGKGFLTERRLPAGLFINKSRPLVPTWEFVRPYTLWPNQQLRSRMSTLVNTFGDLGLMFNGRRLKDNRPVVLYDTTEAYVAAGGGAGFVDRSLRCPGDSPVELHSVGIPEWVVDKAANSAVVQIWSPQGREWFQVSPFAGPPPPADQKWVDPPTDMLSLESFRGWSIGTGQTFLIEFENVGTVDITVMATLRGSVEIDEEERYG